MLAELTSSASRAIASSMHDAPTASPPFLAAILDGPLTALRPLPGSGAAQAPPLAQALCAAGLRASDQSGPPGVAVYLDSSTDVPLAKMAAEEAILWLMCGLAAEQAQLEDGAVVPLEPSAELVVSEVEDVGG